MKYQIIAALITAAINVLFVDGVLVAHGAQADKFFLLGVWTFTMGCCILQGLFNRDLERITNDRVCGIQTNSHGFQGPCA